MGVGNLFAEYGIGVLTAVGVLFAILTFLNSRKGQREQRRRWEITDIEKELAHEGDLANRKSELENRWSLSGYLRRIEALNQWADKFFGLIWSGDSFNRCLKFALIYPAALFIVAWVLGGSGRLAGLEILPPTENVLVRLTLALLLVILSSACVFFFRKRDEIEAIIYRALERGIRVLTFKGNGELKPWITHLLKGASLVGSFAFPMTSFVAVSVAASVAPVVVAITVSVAAFVSVSVSVAAVTVAATGVFFVYVGGNLNLVAMVAFFFLTLPIANALLDFLSLAATRLLLAHTATLKGRKHAGVMLIAHVLGDLVLAVMFLVCLAVLLPNVVEIANLVMSWLGAPTLVEWREHVRMASDDPFGGGVMVWGMLLSTLIPTVLHFSVGIAGWFTSHSRTDELKKLLLDNQEPLSPATRKAAARLFVERERWWIGALLSSLFILASVLGVLFLMAHLGFSLETIALWSVSWRG